MKNWTIITIVALLLIIAVATAYFYSKRKKDEPKKETTTDPLDWKNYSDNGHSGTLSYLNGGPSTGNQVAFETMLPHGLKYGDNVVIAQDPGWTYSEYNGNAKVVQVISDKIFAINKPYLGNGPAKPGKYQKVVGS